MRLEYENKFSDILRFNAIHQFFSPVLQGVYLILIALIFWSELSNSEVTSAAQTTLLWYFGIWIFQFIFNVIYLYSRKNGSILTTHVVEVQDDAFLEETRFNRSLFFWPGVLKAVSRPGFIAVYVTPQMAHIIPSRAFSSKTQRDEFLALVRDKIRASARQA